MGKDSQYNFRSNTDENMSYKSDQNLSLKNKNTKSNKSVSEISEYEEDEDLVDDTGEFPNTIKKKEHKDNQNKLNESLHSATSQFSKDVFEDKDEDKN